METTNNQQNIISDNRGIGGVQGSDIRFRAVSRSINDGNVQDKPKDKKKRHCCIKELFFNYWFLWGIIIILLGTIVFCLIPKIDITNNYVSVIFGFVGILATFIVVSNYAQVKEIERGFDRKIKQIKIREHKNKIDHQKRINSIYQELSDTYRGFLWFFEMYRHYSMVLRCELIALDYSIEGNDISHANDMANRLIDRITTQNPPIINKELPFTNEDTQFYSTVINSKNFSKLKNIAELRKCIIRLTSENA
jgi:hypothetical protein